MNILYISLIIGMGAIVIEVIGKSVIRQEAQDKVTGRETFYFDKLERVLNPQLRTYRPLRYGENPEYLVDFVYTPDLQAAYGARGVGEHGLIGMPGALGNALSIAAGVSLHHLPLTPELIWRIKEGER